MTLTCTVTIKTKTKTKAKTKTKTKTKTVFTSELGQWVSQAKNSNVLLVKFSSNLNFFYFSKITLHDFTTPLIVCTLHFTTPFIV